MTEIFISNFTLDRFYGLPRGQMRSSLSE